MQQKHSNQTQQMRVLVSQQQEFNSVTCQRYNDPCKVSQNELTPENKEKIISTVDTLEYNLRHLESTYDSDATDSSSDCESCDEFEENDYRNSTYPITETALPASSSSTLPSTSSDNKRHIPIQKRYSWKWGADRSAIGSRWSWLQAQVTDLETKVRQQNDIFRHLRATKGSIVFGEDDKSKRQFPSSSSITTSHASVNNNFNHSQQLQSSSLSSLSSVSLSQQTPPSQPPPPPLPLQQQPTQPLSTQGINNVAVSSSSLPPSESTVSTIDANPHPEKSVEPLQEPSTPQSLSQPPEPAEQPAGQLQTEEMEVTPEEKSAEEEQVEEGTCMRTIPYVSMKRRKLVRSEYTLSLAVKKAVKYSSIQCSCTLYPPYVPSCVICTGRYNYMNSIDPEFMPYLERISLLDSACHPVLCMPNDVPVGLHILQILKREDINSKPALLRNNKKKKNNALSPLKMVSGNSIEKTKKLGSVSKTKKKPEKKRRPSSDTAKKVNRDRLSSDCSFRTESPVPSPLSESSSNGASNLTPTTPSAPLQRRRRSEQHAFDINNIVIPYSIAANRIEKPQYKDIITPKWRIYEEFSIPPPETVKQQIINGSSEANMNGNTNGLYEDESNSAFEARHSICEQVERKRILSYILSTWFLLLYNVIIIFYKYWEMLYLH